MEARNSATGDRDKQQGEDAGGAVRNGVAKRRRHHLRAHDEEGAVENDQTHEQLQAVDVVARLQQHPHRQQRGDERIGEQEDDPPTARRDAQHLVGECDRDLVAQNHQPVQRGDADDGDQRQVPVEAIDGLADQQRHHDRAPGGDHGTRRGDEQVRDHDGERRVDHEQQQEDDHQKEVAPARTDVAPRQRADGLAAVPLRRPQRTQVMHSGEEDRAQRDPKKRRDPPPDHRDGRTDDRRRTRDGGEVVAPQDVLVGGDVIHAVFHGVRRGGVGVRELVDPFAQKLRVQQVPRGHHC